MLIRDIKKKKHKIEIFAGSKFLKIAYPAIAGAATSILILYFLNMGSTYEKVISELFSPVVTGVISGSILYILGLKK